jgi:hypothetical protein
MMQVRLKRFFDRNFPVLVTLLGCIILAAWLPGCSSRKLRLPVEEIKRPLSLPPKTWRIGDAVGLHGDGAHYGWLFLNTIFAYPYFQIGNNLEYYIPAQIKYYFVKNVEIKDSILSIIGGNAAVTAGWTGLSYSSYIGAAFTFKGILDFKKPISETIWMTAFGAALFTTNTENYDGSLGAGIGCQFTRRLYATLVPSFSYFRYITLDIFTNDRTSGNKSCGTFPLLFGVNLTEKWTLFTEMAAQFYSGGDRRYSLEVGFHYTW